MVGINWTENSVMVWNCIQIDSSFACCCAQKGSMFYPQSSIQVVAFFSYEPRWRHIFSHLWSRWWHISVFIFGESDGSLFSFHLMHQMVCGGKTPMHRVLKCLGAHGFVVVTPLFPTLNRTPHNQRSGDYWLFIAFGGGGSHWEHPALSPFAPYTVRLITHESYPNSHHGLLSLLFTMDFVIFWNVPR